MECKLSRFIIVLCCFVLLSSCVSANGETEETRKNPDVEYSNETMTVTGSYTEADINEIRVQDALEILREYLKDDNIVIKEPFEAWQQVVSGYKIRIKCLYTQNSEEGVLEGVVYFSPDGEAKVLEVQLESK